MSDEQKYPEACRLNPAMMRRILPEQMEDFKLRYYRSLDRYLLKWGNYPGYQGRAKIVGALCMNFKVGRINNSAWGLRMSKQSNVRKMFNKYQRLGMTKREITLEHLAGQGRKQAAYKERVREAEERRAARRIQTEA